MHRRSILKWTTLIAISISFTLVLSGLRGRDSAWAALVQSGSQDPGSLRAIDGNGKPAGLCPLKHTTVKAEVSGFISRVTVTQDFENPFPEKIEAVYTFPLPQTAAVDDLTMLIGERTVKGKIMRREEAAAAYSTAKQLGQVASLLDQERPNIFTQSLANIMPGQQVRITISYVETLKYEDGSYEWSFPMVVGPRYIPAVDQSAEANAERPAEAMADSSRLNPPTLPGDMRAGHDISLEVVLDAGVPVADVNSETHEIQVEKPDVRRAVVRLKDHATIPNKDFVLKFQVAGNTIEDAVLTHRSERGGFFTLILQPPQRVTAEDVMPKELVFVVDTSGSMEGFPLEKAKETIKIALGNLYPYDTFNLITFAGETKVLFSEPVPATRENLRKAQKFLKNLESHGGTEMMKAIKTALEPSDSQHHVRITCFLTDGQVGNDMSIIAEVQKHPNARVFAMGFGSAPNRFLLDKIAEFGRGEVDYVSETGDTSAVARRFHERVRNPLLTDLSVEWSGLSVTDVYPKRIPDLFSVRPVILTGRYTNGGSGTIRLKGRLAGEDFVREIPVLLPEQEVRHDVLATLWARRRIEDLMGQDMDGLQNGKMQEPLREEITQLGLSYKLMTQFTSFVAIDDVIFTPGGDPHRVDVPVEAVAGSISSGVAGYVTVTASSNTMNSTGTSIGNSITTHQTLDLPLQGRSFLTLASLAPGTVEAESNRQPSSDVTDFAANGQRPTANMIFVDGVSANFGITSGGQSPGASISGSTPALTASGGASGLAPLGATEEVTIYSSPIDPEYGRTPGSHVSVITRSGTNTLHGSAFYFLGDDALDANDWFANNRSLSQPARRLNNFGGTFGGPIKRDQTFFFASYEGLRLRQPMAALTSVPSTPARLAAPPEIRSFLAAFPIANGAVQPDGSAEFASTFVNSARHNAASIRIDNLTNSRLAISGRYNFADSEANQRGVGNSSLNTTNRIRSRSQTLTGVFSHTVSPTVVAEVRANYSRLKVSGSYFLDNFGGSLPTDLLNFIAADRSFTFDLNNRNGSLMSASEISNIQRQLNIVGSATMIRGTHTIKFGGDYRRLSPIIGLPALEESVLFDGVAQSLTGVAARVSRFQRSGPQRPIFNNISLYGQDAWRQTARLTLTYGVRWEINPAPSTTSGPKASAVDQTIDLSQMHLARQGTPLWSTNYGNFAPRFGFAYQLSKATDQELILRGSLGISFDTGQERAGDAFADSQPVLSGASAFNSPFPADLSVASNPGTLPFSVFDPSLKLPYTLHWNISLQRAIGSSQNFSATYVGSNGRRLLHTETLFDSHPQFSFVRLTTNGGRSDYRSLQLQFDRRVANNVTALVSYTWSHSLDNVSHDSARSVLMTSANNKADRGASDFDVRHNLTGFVSYNLPTLFREGLGNAISRNWSVDSIFNLRSAKPLNVVYGFPTSFGFAYFRPDLVAGAPLYLADTSVGGGRRINPEAFIIPTDLEQGSLSRNSLRGFPLYQLDLSLRRRFNFTETLVLQLQADAFNVFNHPNFEDPRGTDLSVGSRLLTSGTFRPNPTFGQSASLKGRSGEGFGSFYNTGGSRVLRFSAKLMF